MKSDELGKLISRRDSLNAQIERLNQERQSIGSKIDRLRSEVETLNQRIRKSEKVVVTSDAVVQYLIKHKGLDLDEVRKELLPPEVEERIRSGEQGVVHVSKDITLKTRKGEVFAVVDGEEQK